MTKYNIIDKFLGYQHKTDVTKLPPGVLIYPSQNVTVNDGETVASLQNYSLDGEQGVDVDGGIVASFDWLKSTNGYSHLRAGGDLLQLRYEDADGVISWIDLQDGWTSTFFQFISWWDENEEQDAALFVNGDSNIYKWGGGVSAFVSATATTMTGADVWATARFYLHDGSVGSSTTQFDITNPSGTTYRYTWDSTGTDPVINATTFPIGTTVYVKVQNFDAANNGVFMVTGSGANYFEVTNASGVAETNKTIGTGFIEPNAKSVVVEGDTYYYHGGADTTVLTNVTPDPTLAGHTVGAIVLQGVTTYANAPASNTDFFTNDIIGVLYNQVWIGSSINQEVYVSSQTNFTDFSFTDPRLPGEGAIIRLDAPPRSFAPNEEAMQVSCGESLWYKIVATLNADQNSEALVTTLLKSGASQGAISQGGTFYIKNSVVYISNEPTLDSLGKVENIITQQTVPISDPIKLDFDSYDFGRVHGTFNKNFIYIALPLESRLLMFDIQDGYWNPPWILPAGRLAIIGGELYMHSNEGFTTYKLFDETSTLENVILSRAIFSYINDGDRVNKKTFNERYQEGYLTASSDVTRLDYLDWEGATDTISTTILGNDSTVILTQSNTNALGENPLGEEPLGDTVSELPARLRFRVIRGVVGKDFREVSTEFTSEGVNKVWEITAFGYNTTNSSQNNFDILQ